MIKIRSVGRECDGCTKCCEGWLYGSAYGHSFSPNKKCIFLNKGCTIYPVRPDDPCKQFRCQWKVNKSLPDWLKPDVSDVIILKKKIKVFEYLYVISAGSLVTDTVHEWAKNYSREKIENNVVIWTGLTHEIYSIDKNFEEALIEHFKS